MWRLYISKMLANLVMLKEKGQWLKAHVLYSKQYRKLNAGTLYFLKENG